MGWKIIDFVPILYKEGYTVLDVKFQKIVRDISNLCIGVNANLELAKEIAEAAGIKLKKLGVDAVIFGTLDTLSKDDKEPLNRFSTSPYITAKILELMAEGFANAGIFPIVDGRGKIDQKVLETLKSKKLFLPIFVENEKKAKYIQSLGYETTFYSYKGPIVGKEITLSWEDEKTFDINLLRKKILQGSVVILNSKASGIAINDPYSDAKVLIFSADDWLVELAKKVERGKTPATGRRVW